MAKHMRVEIVSPEGEMFSGEASLLQIKGAEGDLGIHPGHLQLLTRIVPGAIRIQQANDEEELLYISGGIMEVQPHQISILADSVERPQDVNEAAAMEAKLEAEKLLAGKVEADHHKVKQDLAEAMAKLQVLELMRSRKKR
jgi:F-type H+-transporting ATPase subunit epsilon